MPAFHAHIPAGKFSSAEKRALAAAFHRALMEAVNLHRSGSPVAAAARI
jgi:hypothetical protein